MPLVLAIEPDPRQAAVLERVVKGQVRAEFVLVDSKDAALAALAARIPDVILVTALMAPRDEDEIAGYLKTMPHAGHVQTLAIPLLADKEPEPSLTRRLFNPLRRKAGKAATDGCAPTMFGEQIQAYLQRAAENRQELEAEMTAAIEPARETDVQPASAIAELRPADAAAELAPEDAVAALDGEADLIAEIFAGPPRYEPAAASVEETALLIADDIDRAADDEAVEEGALDHARAAIAAPALEAGTEPVDQEPANEAAPELAAQEAAPAPEVELAAHAAESEPIADASLAASPEAQAAPEPQVAEAAEPQVAPADEPQVEQAVEPPAEPPVSQDETRWIWTGARPLPAMAVFQMFLADTCEESPVRGYQLRRARPADVRLIAECSVVAEPECVSENATDTTEAAPDLDTALWDKLFVALEDRFNQEKAKVASTEAAAAEQARKYIQARKAARKRVPRSDRGAPPSPAGGRRTTSSLESLRMDIERVLRKTAIPERPHERRSRQASSLPPAEPDDPAGAVGKQASPIKPATATARKPRSPEPPPPVRDEWGFDDDSGFAEVIAKIDEAEAHAATCSSPNTSVDARAARREEPARIAPLSVWAHAVDPEPELPLVPLEALGHAVTDPALRLPDDVVAVRYASGCRIGEIRIAERPPEADGSEEPVVLLSKKLLKKPR